MADVQQRLRASISMGTEPLCFLVCCAGCGEYLLLNQNVVYRALHTRERIVCPPAGSNQPGVRSGKRPRGGMCTASPLSRIPASSSCRTCSLFW